jgi:nitroimidazol reductase NimA-like FMN-containing flavoprotein (pyridoxamine 5'-phosphate oxidase superfamily)
MEQGQVQKAVRGLFETQAFGVLATRDVEQPYTALVAFSATRDMRRLLFATERSTTKFANVKQHPHVSMLIDNRTNHPRDFSQATAVTVLGEASEVPNSHRDGLLQLHIIKHPYLEAFIRAPSSALMELSIHKIILVTRFQRVVEWVLDESTDVPCQ